MKRKFVYFLIVSVTSLSIYYFFLRPYEYAVNFKAKTTSGDIIQTVRIWNKSLESGVIDKVDSFHSLQQSISYGSRNYLYHWYLRIDNDSITKVNVKISEPTQSFLNKVLVPFTEQPIEQDAAKLITEFYEVLQAHLNITKVEVLGETNLEPSFCVCRSLIADQLNKANGMMKDYTLLTSYIESHNLVASGPPSVRIKEWNHSNGKIKFDFCFSILPIDSLPDAESVFFKKFEGVLALKAEYHGNYITSDRAWYALLQFAQLRDYPINNKPIELFYDNPNLGLNEKEWRAEVFMPLNRE
jgi:effector-binding domain-containing protein